MIDDQMPSSGPPSAQREWHKVKPRKVTGLVLIAPITTPVFSWALLAPYTLQTANLLLSSLPKSSFEPLDNLTELASVPQHVDTSARFWYFNPPTYLTSHHAAWRAQANRIPPYTGAT